MAAYKDRLDAAGVEVLVVGFEDAHRLTRLKQRLESPFCFVVDQERAAYGAFSLGRASWARTYLHPDVVAGYVRMLGRGKKPDLRWGQDRRQLGGDVVLDAAGRVIFSHPERGPEDRAAVGRIIAAAVAPGEC